MPDEQGNELTDEDEVPETSLHAHAEGREEEVEGDPAPDAGDEGDVDEDGPGNPVDDADGGDADEEE